MFIYKAKLFKYTCVALHVTILPNISWIRNIYSKTNTEIGTCFKIENRPEFQFLKN